jgi:DNA (cytosine-5)-methyltransferase 1
MTTLAPARHSFDSLFSGIAGLDNGLHRRMPCNLVVEEAAHPRAILRKHFPHVRQMNDVREVKGTDLRGTILVAGFPCKDTSIAGPRVGLAGARSGLFFEIIRLMQEHRPEWVIVENPDGALTSNKGRDWLTVTRDFTREGYSWAYRVVDARTLDSADLRSPQKRTRIILVAHRDGDIGPCLDVLGLTAADYAAVQPDTPKVTWGTAGTGGPDNVTVTGAAPAPTVEALPSWDTIITNAPADDASCWLTPEQAEKLLPRLRSHAGLDPELLAAVEAVADGTTPMLDSAVRVWRKSARAQKSIEAGGWESWVRSAHSNTLTCFDIGGPLRQTHLIYQGGRVRTLTLTEWERLCGFEDGWTEGIPDGARFTALGNCVHVGTGEWLAEQLVSVMVRMEAEQDWRLFA